MTSDIGTKRVGILMGGPSSERDISIKSGNAVCRALETKKINTIPIELRKAETMNGYRESVIQLLRSYNIDIAFIALHGKFGEDGSMQEILEYLGIPYTGSRVESSRLGMDKVSSKDIFKSINIHTPRHIVVHKRGLDKGDGANVYFKELGSPLVIKPSNEGSSIGLSIVDREADLLAAIDSSFEFGDKAIIEEYVAGQEVTVGILDDIALPVIQILPKNRFFDFESKYQRGLTEYRVPAEIHKEEYKNCQEIALKVHNALGARCFSRVDMILKTNGLPVVLEVNTVPGLTETSLLPMAAKSVGIDFGQLVLKILKSAL